MHQRRRCVLVASSIIELGRYICDTVFYVLLNRTTYWAFHNGAWNTVEHRHTAWRLSHRPHFSRCVTISRIIRNRHCLPRGFAVRQLAFNAVGMFATSESGHRFMLFTPGCKSMQSCRLNKHSVRYPADTSTCGGAAHLPDPRGEQPFRTPQRRKRFVTGFQRASSWVDAKPNAKRRRPWYRNTVCTVLRCDSKPGTPPFRRFGTNWDGRSLRAIRFNATSHVCTAMEHTERWACANRTLDPWAYGRWVTRNHSATCLSGRELVLPTTRSSWWVAEHALSFLCRLGTPRAQAITNALGKTTVTSPRGGNMNIKTGRRA